MRTDAKIGFAIAGVLVAVVLVYFVVIPRHGRQAKVSSTTSDGTVKLVPPAPNSPGPEIAVPPTTGGNSDNPPVIPPGQAKPIDPTPPITVTGPVAGLNGSTPPMPPLIDDAPPAPPFPKLTPPTNKQKVTAGNTVPQGNANGTPPRSKRHSGPAATDGGDRPTVALAGQRTYTVRAGQTLTSIASDLYGDPRAWRLIQTANPKLNPARLRVGTRIVVPDPTAVHPHPDVTVIPAAETVIDDGAAVSTSSGQRYIVKPGDSLYRIAKQLLGSGREADALFQLNRDVIGSSPSRLRQGMVLRLPAAALSDANG